MNAIFSKYSLSLQWIDITRRGMLHKIYMI